MWNARKAPSFGLQVRENIAQHKDGKTSSFWYSLSGSDDDDGAEVEDCVRNLVEKCTSKSDSDWVCVPWLCLLGTPLFSRQRKATP